jgi:hypothetical protein
MSCQSVAYSSKTVPQAHVARGGGQVHRSQFIVWSAALPQHPGIASLASDAHNSDL